MTDTKTLVEIDDLKVHFGGVHAVDGVSFTIAKGSLCGLVGPNGSGKTTLVNAISGMVHATAGEVRIDGLSFDPLTAPQRARAGVRRTFQAIRLLPRLTVLENVMLGADESLHLLQPVFRPLHAARAQRKSRAAALASLERVGLSHAAHESPGALPYGHQRRVEIARALACGPQLLLLDEPVAGMSAEEREEIAQLLLSLKDEGLTQLLIEHDLGLVTRITDHLIVMDFGRVIADGDPKKVTREDHVKEAYLGRRHNTVA